MREIPKYHGSVPTIDELYLSALYPQSTCTTECGLVDRGSQQDPKPDLSMIDRSSNVRLYKEMECWM
jgi:hypothetical protein